MRRKVKVLVCVGGLAGSSRSQEQHSISNVLAQNGYLAAWGQFGPSVPCILCTQIWSIAF